jgi:hypothetical protein
MHRIIDYLGTVKCQNVETLQSIIPGSTVGGLVVVVAGPVYGVVISGFYQVTWVVVGIGGASRTM